MLWCGQIFQAYLRGRGTSEMWDCFLLLDETTSLYENGGNTAVGSWQMWMTSNGEEGEHQQGALASS